jgi:ABC-type branched-subunit amino acid transport system substrate-binding protein
MPKTPVLPTVLLAGALALSGCGKGGGDDKKGDGDLATDVGVSSSEITLGVMTDNTGPFKNLGLGVVQGHKIWTDETNEDGGICGRKIKLEVRDHAYKADTAKVQFPELEPKVLGFMQVLGSPVNAALDSDLTSAKTTAVALSWSSEILDNPYIIIPGTTYDIEMINGLSYLLDEKLIKEGDTIGHIYIDGEYGANGLRGAQYFADKHKLKIVTQKVTSTDTDMKAAVTKFKGEKVKAIALTTSPAQTASAAANNAGLKLDVPLVGNNPTFAPQLLDTPAKAALAKLYLVASSVPFGSDVPKAVDIAKKYKDSGATELPNAGVPYGYAIGSILGQLLEKACSNKDMTRDGIQKALQQSTSITTDNLVADLDFSSTGTPATREVYIAVPDEKVDGGLRQVKPLFASDDAKTYVAPHEKRTDDPAASPAASEDAASSASPSPTKK